MPNYRFSLEDHHFVADHGMYHCDDETKAQIIANEIADRLASERAALVEGGHAIVVRDEKKRLLYRAGMDRSSVLSRRN